MAINFAPCIEPSVEVVEEPADVDAEDESAEEGSGAETEASTEDTVAETEASGEETTVDEDGNVLDADGNIVVVPEVVVPEVPKLCSATPDILDFLKSHKLHMRYRQHDDSDNGYWMEEPLPDLGKAMSIYLREVTTIDEDQHYFFGHAFFKLIDSNFETPGITTKLVVSKVINNHDQVDKDQELS